MIQCRAPRTLSGSVAASSQVTRPDNLTSLSVGRLSGSVAASSQVTRPDNLTTAHGYAGRDCQPAMTSRNNRAVSLGVLPTRTPTASSASFLAAAVPDDPETIAPAWPMVRPSRAVKPAT
jgi:hypothetical protein